MPSRPIPTATGRHGRHRRRSCSRGSWISVCRSISEKGEACLAPTLLALTLTLGACRGTAPSDSTHSVSTQPVTYNTDIAPILNQHCASCHRPISGDPHDPLCIAGAPSSSPDYTVVKRHAQDHAHPATTPRD